MGLYRPMSQCHITIATNRPSLLNGGYKCCNCGENIYTFLGGKMKEEEVQELHKKIERLQDELDYSRAIIRKLIR